MSKSLLDKARSTKRKLKSVSDEEVELAIAWIKGEIEAEQVIAALGKERTNGTWSTIAAWSAVRLRRAISLKMVRISVIEKIGK